MRANRQATIRKFLSPRGERLGEGRISRLSSLVVFLSLLLALLALPHAVIACGTIDHYTVYRGTETGTYTTTTNVGSGLTATITSLPTGTYYFAVTAVDQYGVESDYSNEVIKYVTNGTAVLTWDAPTTYSDGSAIGPCSPPNVPTKLHITNSFQLIWTNPVTRVSGSSILPGETQGTYLYTSASSMTYTTSSRYLVTAPTASVVLSYSTTTAGYNDTTRTLYLDRGKKFFTVKTLDTDNQESAASNEAHYWSAPENESPRKPGGFRRIR